MTPSGSGTRLTWDLRQPAYRRHSPPRHAGPRRAVSKYNRQGRQGYGQGKDWQPFRMLLFSEETNKTASRLPVQSQFVHLMKHGKLVGVLTVFIPQIKLPLVLHSQKHYGLYSHSKAIFNEQKYFQDQFNLYFHYTRSKNFICVPLSQ